MAFQTTLTPELIERSTDQGYWLGRTITDHLDEAAQRTPEKHAFVDSRTQITYAERGETVPLRAWKEKPRARLCELHESAGAERQAPSRGPTGRLLHRRVGALLA
jgi:hypothetical protein